MFLFKKNFYFYLYNFFLILVFIFNEFSTNQALSKSFNISQVEIEEIYDINFDKSKVIDKSFRKAFDILIFKIVEKKDRFVLNNVKLKEIKSLIDTFSIVNEKFINNNYQSEFEVQFNRRKIYKYLEKNNVVPSLPIEVESFILPILVNTKNNEVYYLNQNIFFNNWNNKSKNFFLIKYILPNEDIEDYLTIKKNINNIENYNFNEIVNKYSLDNHIILVLLKKDRRLRVFSKMKLDQKKMLINKIYEDVNIDDQEIVSNIINDIKEDYEDKWKSINKLNTSIALPIRLSIDSKNIKLSEKLEKTLSNMDLVSEYKIEKINNKEIIYKVIFNSSPDKFIQYVESYNFDIDISTSVWKLQ